MAQPVSNCIICDAVLRHALAKYCRRCGNILQKIESAGKADIEARTKVLQKAWDAENECFRCHYSGIMLVDNDHRDPRYITFDYTSPGKGAEMVITAALIKIMKQDMSANGFKDIITQLARHFSDGSAVDENIFKEKNYRG